MTKLKDLKDILDAIPKGKKITSTAIMAVADIDYFRKNKPNTVVEKGKIKINFETVFAKLFTTEQELNPVCFNMEIAGIFSGMSDRLFLCLMKEIDSDKRKNIAKISIGCIEEDTSFLDEPSEYSKFFVFDITYKPKEKFVKQTDKEVVDSLKSQLGQLRSQIQ
jgi:hypothetical protein